MDRMPIEAWIQKNIAEELVAAAGLDLATLEEKGAVTGIQGH